jgi:signal transduction histidine kinase
MFDQKVQEQKKITRAILEAQEKERNYIGRELHDNVNQILSSSKMYLDILASENEEVRELATRSVRLIESAIQEIRALTRAQVAPMKNIDLQDSITLLLDVVKESTPMRTTFNYNVDNAIINDELKLNIFRIVQEQINNIIKHAQATNINISLESDDQAVNIVVADDGKGFDTSKKKSGIGIKNMMNRVESFNGEMKVESAPGKGTSFFVRLPY